MVHAGCDCRPMPLQLNVADNEVLYSVYKITSLLFLLSRSEMDITLTIRRRMIIVMIRILCSDHDACYCDGHCRGMAEAPDTNGEQCSVREQLLRAQTRLQEMQALPDSMGLTQKQWVVKQGHMSSMSKIGFNLVFTKKNRKREGMLQEVCR